MIIFKLSNSMKKLKLKPEMPDKPPDILSRSNTAKSLNVWWKREGLHLSDGQRQDHQQPHWHQQLYGQSCVQQLCQFPLGTTREWLFAFVDMMNYTTAQLTCTRFKPFLQMEFAVQSNEKLIIDGLSNLAMKANETTRELLTRVN